LLGLEFLVLFACAQRGSKPVIRPNLSLSYQRYSGYLLQPPFSNDAIDVFDRSALLELRRAVRLQSIFKTSFSRLDPIPRGQATVIRSSIRPCQRQRTIQQPRATSFLPTSSPSTISSRLGHPWFLRNWARTSKAIHKNCTKHLEASRSIFSSRYMQNRHQAEADAKLYFFKGYANHSLNTKANWWS